MLEFLIRIAPMWLVNSYKKDFLKSFSSVRYAMEHGNPRMFEVLMHKSAIYTYNVSREKVPEYRKFLDKMNHNVKVSDIKKFEDVPETNKKNYIFASEHLADLCKGGDLTKVHFWVKSSGHSGVEREWGKSNEEVRLSAVSLSAGMDLVFDIRHKTTLIINAYILSSWVSGISFALMGHENNAIINVGPSEKEIIDTIKMFEHEYDQIIILGYPPFIKHLVDYGERKKFSWKGYKIHFFVGGEYFPEEWRDYIIDKTKPESKDFIQKVIGGYGSSDFGIIGGIETDESIVIRKYAKEHPKFADRLFGKTRTIPMLFQYAPFIYIHSNDKKELLYTTLLPENPMPLVNYNLKDVGTVIPYEDMHSVLKEHGIDMHIRMKFPFVAIEGRSSGAVKLCAFMIYPENIKECIYRIKDIAKTTTGKFKLRIEYDKKENEQFYIDFELLKHIKKSKKLTQTYASNIQKVLREINQGYDSICKNIPESSNINVILYEYGTFPHDSGVKFKYT